jgi:hypothetical protein
MATNQRVQAAATRTIESCRRVERIADGMLEEMEDVTPIHGIPLTDLDDEDSAVIALEHALAPPGVQSAAGPADAAKKRVRTEPGIKIR